MESTSKQNYVEFSTTTHNTASSTNSNKIIKNISTNRQKLLFNNRLNNFNNYDCYRNFSSKKFNNNNNINNKKKFPIRTTSLYELSSSSSSLSLLYKESIDNYDNDDIVKNIVCLSPTSSLSSSSSPPPTLPQLSSLSTIRNGYHRNYDGNYRKFSSCRQHNFFRDTIITQYSPPKDMASIVERRSGSSSVEKDTSAIMKTQTPTTTTTPIIKKENYHQTNNNSSTILREKIYNNEISTNDASNNCEFLSSGSSSSPSWLFYDDIDAIKGKMKMKSSQQQQQQQQFSSDKNNSYSHREYQHHSQQNQKYSEVSGRYRYSESEKESSTITLNSKRTFGIRTRSESEPNDICNMKNWTSVNGEITHTDVVDEKMSKRTNDEQCRFVEIHRQQYSSYKLPPKNPQRDNVINKRTTRSSSSPITSPRLSIYTKSSKSPGIIRKPPSTRSQSSSTNISLIKNVHSLKSSHISNRVNSSNGCGSPRRRRSNNSTIIASTRRCRTKSPSPTYIKGSNKYYGSTGVSSAVTFRKAKSVTPPPKLTRHHQSLISPSLPASNDFVSSLKCSKKSSQSSVPRFLHSAKYESDNDNDEDNDDDDDDDFDNNLNDDGEDDDDDLNSSSDSENGYRAHAYVSNFEKSSSISSFQCQANNANVIDTTINYVPPSCPLVPSLFPNVPPYLAFSTDSEKGPQLPQQVHKILKWKLTTIMPKVVRRILINSGFRLLKKTNDWMGTWGKHMKSPCFRAIRPYQKINHLPGSFKIGRKDSCWKNLQIQMIKYGKKEFGFMPKTYIIPQDLKILRKSWPKYAQKNFKWIIKPPASARGTGIKVVNRWSQIPKRKPVIVQRYIERPFLINGSKFDLRLYVLVTSINPLRVYLYHDGLVRFASVKYSEKSDTLSDRCMHLTNYSINKFSSNYAKNEDVYACHGHKWTIKSLWAFFEKRGINTNRLWGAFRNLILRTLLAGESAINAMIKLNVESKYNCFELFGFDILLDSELVPWLLEVNISPSLHSELTLDLHVKAPLVQAVLNTALYHIPPKLSTDQQKELLNRHGLQGPLCFDKRLYVTYLSRAEKLKHQQFTKKSLEDRDEYLDDILENLTPDDIRCLITTEDELSRCKPLERIFPTQYTYKYLKYTEQPRYYNRLLDAWENKYGKNRLDGINLLKSLCEQKMHLDIPPVPMRKPIKIRTRTLMRRRIMKTATTSTSSTAVTATMTPYLALTTTIKSIKKRNNRKSSKIKAEILTKLKNLQNNSTTTSTLSTSSTPIATTTT